MCVCGVRSVLNLFSWKGPYALVLVISYELGSGERGKFVLVYWSRTRYIVLVLVISDELGSGVCCKLVLVYWSRTRV